MKKVNRDWESKYSGLEESIKKLRESLEQEKDSKLTLEEKQDKSIKKALDDVEELREQVKQEKEQLLKDLERARLQVYTEKKLREAGDGLILELVHGDTPEEIDASIEVAKARYAEIEAKTKEAVTRERQTKAEVPVTNPVSDKTVIPDLARVDEMTDREWGEKRQGILETVKKMSGIK